MKYLPLVLLFATGLVVLGRRRKREMISLLVPRKPDGGHRDRAWRWLRRYWKFGITSKMEIVIGRDPDPHRPFSKTAAVNDAARRARGDIFVILDADAYLRESVIEHCAARIRRARMHGCRLWFVPYTHLYRLTETATSRLLASSPKYPLRFSSPPHPDDVEDTSGSGHGHTFGAMITIMPREAFELVGGMDERFRGWGGEDVSFLRALDTLYAPHKTTPNDVLHAWHPRGHVGTPHKTQIWRTRTWDGQDMARVNDWLAIQYNQATNRPRQMRALVDTGFPPKRHPWKYRLSNFFRR